MEAGNKIIASTEGVNLNQQSEWEGKPGEVRIPEVYLKDLKFEIVVFTRKERGGSDFTFRCKEYEKTANGGWRFGFVIIDTSRRDPQGKVEVARITYHPEVVLVDTSFMVLPAPDLDATY